MYSASTIAVRSGAARTSVGHENPWLIRMDAPEALPTLVLIPHAGAGAGAYRRLARALRDVARPIIVRLPGRESRLDEPAHTDIRTVVRELVPVLLPHLGDRSVLYGHSMGALIAFEAARLLQLAYGTGPARLVVSGMEAPQDRFSGSGRHRLPDEELWMAVCGLGGMPPEIAKDETMRELLLPTLRADFQAVDDYTYLPAQRLTCPVSSYAGSADVEARPNQMIGWSAETRGGFEHTVLPGDHFFNLDRKSGFTPALRHLAIATGEASVS